MKDLNIPLLQPDDLITDYHCKHVFYVKNEISIVPFAFLSGKEFVLAIVHKPYELLFQALSTDLLSSGAFEYTELPEPITAGQLYLHISNHRTFHPKNAMKNIHLN